MSGGSTAGSFQKGAGAGSGFSAACKRAMVDCGYPEEKFGTVEELEERQAVAQARAEAIELGGDAESSAARIPPDEASLRSTTVTSVHDRVYQGEPGNVGSNYIDGYDSSRAPAIALGSLDNDPNLDTEAGQYAAMENAAHRDRREALADSGRLKTGPGHSAPIHAHPAQCPYRPDQARNDEDARMQALLERGRRRRKDRRDPTAASPPSTGAGTEGGPAGAAGEEVGVDGPEELASAEGPPEAEAVNPVGQAAECIAEWRTANAQAMREACVAGRDEAERVEALSEAEYDGELRHHDEEVAEKETAVGEAEAREQRLRASGDRGLEDASVERAQAQVALRRAERDRTRFKSTWRVRGTDQAWSKQAERIEQNPRLTGRVPRVQGDPRLF
ncbi:MAG: hypothetical protein AAGF12_07845 [Myxococcota bacterium]